jgi:hypothetical protein
MSGRQRHPDAEATPKERTVHNPLPTDGNVVTGSSIVGSRASFDDSATTKATLDSVIVQSCRVVDAARVFITWAWITMCRGNK